MERGEKRVDAVMDPVKRLSNFVHERTINTDRKSISATVRK